MLHKQTKNYLKFTKKKKNWYDFYADIKGAGNILVKEVVCQNIQMILELL